MTCTIFNSLPRYFMWLTPDGDIFINSIDSVKEHEGIIQQVMAMQEGWA